MFISTDKKWDYDLGMIKVDGLKLSAELERLFEKEKCWFSKISCMRM